MKGNEQAGNTRSLREVVYAINNEQDLNNYLGSFASKVPARASEIKYERNAVRSSFTSANEILTLTGLESFPIKCA